MDANRARNFLRAHILEEEPIGYAVCDEETLVEFYILPEEIKRSEAALKCAIRNFNATSLMYKSFDSVVVNASASLRTQDQIMAHLYRKTVDRKFVENLKISARLATGEDALIILSIHDGYFGDFSEVESYLEEKSLFIYFDSNDAAVGCGVLKRTPANPNYFDIEVVVAPEHRRKQMGSYIVSHLRSYCQNLGCKPISSCIRGDEPAQGILERAGFVSEHNLCIAMLILTDSYLTKATY